MDEENFKLLMNVFCRVLEGRPLCRCVILTSKRGRNSKGIVEKMLQSTMGDYHVPVRSTVFQTDRRSEHEHNAADAARIGARIGFGNEVQGVPWSNAIFKNKNSSDPMLVRGCGVTDSKRAQPTLTFFFACNDPPVWEQPPKGSERDRLTVLYLPNKYVNKDDVPTSPRTFLKDNGLEDHIAHGDFALGHLMNLLQLRLDHAAHGRKLDDLIAAGTGTSKHLLDSWMSVWAAPASGGAAAMSEEAENKIKELHQVLYQEGKTVILQCQLLEHTSFPGTKHNGGKSRWAQMLQLIANSGPAGAILFQKSTGTSRKGISQPAFKILRVDLFKYEVCFQDTACFGDLSTMTFPASLVDCPCLPVWSSLHPDATRAPDADTLPSQRAATSINDLDLPLDGIPSPRKKILYKADWDDWKFSIRHIGGLCNLNLPHRVLLFFMLFLAT